MTAGKKKLAHDETADRLFAPDVSQISQTHIKTELEAVRDDYEIEITCLKPANFAYTHHAPYLWDRAASRGRAHAPTETAAPRAEAEPEMSQLA